MSRRQLPPQIKKVEVLDRKTGKAVVRYQLTVDAGVNPETGKRQQVRRRYATEREARAALAEIGDTAAKGVFVARRRSPSSGCAPTMSRAATSYARRRCPSWRTTWRRCGSGTATCRCSGSPRRTSTRW